MIPRRIRLRNFLSYRECEVTLTGLHLAVLAGKNGDGKSALLDAMTWAVWGEARGSVEEDRIRATEQEMLVDFEFEAHGDVFEVIRKRTRGRRTGEVHFFQVAPDGGKTTLTGGTISETEAEILRRVRMDFDTFASSAFVVQGRANEFTKKKPAERKEVFRKILGLQIYEELSTRATERKRYAAGQITSIGAIVGEAEGELATLPAVEAEIVRIAAESTALLPRRERLEAVTNELRRAVTDFQRLETEARTARERARRTAQAIAEDEARLVRNTTELEQAQSTLADAENVLERYATLQELRARERHLAGLQEQAAAIESRIEAHGREVAAEEARLQARADALKEDVTRLTVLAAALPALHAQALEFESMRAGIAALDASVEASRSRTAELKSTQAGAEAEARQCKEANKELHQKQEQLRAAEGEASCPICRQPLSPGDIEHVMAEYAAQRKQLGERFSQAEQAARTAAEESARLDGEVSTMQRQGQHQREDLQRRERDHHALLKAAEEATEALPRREAELAALLVTIPDGAFAAEPRQRLQAAHAELAAVGYDAGAHRAVRDQVIALDGVDDEMRAVTSAGERAAALGEQQGQLDASLAARRLEMAEAEAAAEASEAALALTEDAGPRLGQQEAELASLQSQERDLAVQQGRMEQQRHHLRETMARVETARELLQAHREEEQTYGDLAKAFGRDGVQAMLIDQSLPRIEQVANGMLDHMTGGRIHVALATQRLTAKGTVQETLDIRISDEMGTRDYEMYSGGEAFRVDFALRIALARLLAERAGAELPTLIIDEGFGSQDQEGIDRLVEAIQAVRDEFRLILVVTHVEELRERFERRIEVTKDPERGSFARVV